MQVHDLNNFCNFCFRYKFFGEKKNNVNRLPVYGHYKKMFARNWKQSKIHHDIGKVIYSFKVV